MGFSSRPVLPGCFHPVSAWRDIPSGRDDFLHVNRNIPRSRTCNHVSQIPTIRNLVSSFTVHKQNTCSSLCFIYAIRCRKCEILYIGETCRQLNERFGENIRNVEHKLHEDEKKKDQTDINVSQHFNSRGHSIQDMSILGLLDAPIDSRIIMIIIIIIIMIIIIIIMIIMMIIIIIIIIIITSFTVG